MKQGAVPCVVEVEGGVASDGGAGVAADGRPSASPVRMRHHKVAERAGGAALRDAVPGLNRSSKRAAFRRGLPDLGTGRAAAVGS
eukprot:365495-Chlamydomonas_euryale.AAC.9